MYMYTQNNGATTISLFCFVVGDDDVTVDWATDVQSRTLGVYVYVEGQDQVHFFVSYRYILCVEIDRFHH